MWKSGWLLFFALASVHSLLKVPGSHCQSISATERQYQSILLNEKHKARPLSVTKRLCHARAAEGGAALDLGAYIHIPFCRRRCFYCDFPIQVIGERPSTQAQRSADYASWLLREIDVFSRAWAGRAGTEGEGNNGGPLSPLRTLYFGGGTPSLMTDECIARIISKLERVFGFAPGIEVTLEMDPGTFDAPRIARLAQAGVSRVSVGLQSFDDTVLQKAGRAHTSLDSYRALHILSNSDMVKSFSVDLIASLPFLGLENWQRTLDIVSGARVPHVSVYDLQLEASSAFGRWYTEGTAPLPSEDTSVEMYAMASRTLRQQHGYEHYELSNYAISKEHKSQHNLRYWRLKDTLGFGLGAASYVGGTRFTRPTKMKDYEDFVASGEADSGQYRLVTMGEASVNSAPDMLEYIMLGLRTADGIDLDELQANFDKDVRVKVEKALHGYMGSEGDGALVVQKAGPNNASNRLRLSDPEGFLVSNEIISSVFAALSDGVKD